MTLLTPTRLRALPAILVANTIALETVGFLAVASLVLGVGHQL